MKKIIIANKEKENRVLLSKYFFENGYEALEVDTSFAFKKIEKSGEEYFACVIDYNFLAENDMEFLLGFIEYHPKTRYIILTTSESIVTYFNNNYPDIIAFLKPIFPDELLKQLEK